MEKMNYDEFKEYVATNIRDFLPEKEKKNVITLSKIMKVNQTLDCLTIKRPGSKIIPNIYLNSLYEQYKDGKGIDEILREIADTWTESISNEICDLLQYENMTPELIKERVYYQLINKEKNRSLLEQVPHRDFCDLAVIYRYLFNDSCDGIVSGVITNYCMSDGMTEQDLFTYAEANTERLFGIKVQTMEDMRIEQLECTKQNFSDPSRHKYEISQIDAQISTIRESSTNNPFQLYVASNIKGINGATVLLNTEVMGKLSNQLSGDLLIIPSSIHECIICEAAAIDVDEAYKMLHEVNETVLEEADYLSDTVYYYDRETGEIMDAYEALSKIQVV